MAKLFGATVLLALLAVAAPASAQDSKLPYWASIRSKVVNMRVGPGSTYRIEWVYRRPLLPLKVIRRKEGWRLVRDADGAQGWVNGSFLSRNRTAIVIGSSAAEMRKEASASSFLMWRLDPGVVANLRECGGGWCEIEISRHRGFVRKERLWGAAAP